MLTFVGLGLYDEHSITVEGREALRSADRVFAEFYTSRLVGTTIEELEDHHGVSIEVRDRAGVEQEPAPILDSAETGSTVFLVAGDPMVSTTHTDLRLRAHEHDIETRIIHGTTAQTAAGSLTGLQNYRFGKATTIPFAYRDRPIPESVVETIEDNRERGLHTLCYLDIKAAEGRYMSADVAAGRLAPELDGLGVVVARAGSPDPLVVADRLSALAEGAFGDPLHLLVLPGELHHLEREALEALADAPPELL
ncbi:diphthine synthase [Halococcus thailandensis]|uniref:Diphthine synthase n=1 Tax=Halococcus thailandensis JCM 13552 TaxID=1227457 RepID=M0N230_9EURY|nr:diphthine synthase [Halococcus thailandensis]EMA51558.1 diphthine synthase [Halococcus thailandensis JCM 13552]